MKVISSSGLAADNAKTLDEMVDKHPIGRAV